MPFSLLPLLLAAVTAVQPLLAGAHGHESHALPLGSSAAGTCHADHEHGPHGTTPDAPWVPADEDDCTICRHFWQPTLLTLDFAPLSLGEAIEPLCIRETTGGSLTVVRLKRARSPPRLG